MYELMPDYYRHGVLTLIRFLSRFITGPKNNLRRVIDVLTPVVHERLSLLERKQNLKDGMDTPVGVFLSDGTCLHYNSSSPE